MLEKRNIIEDGRTPTDQIELEKMAFEVDIKSEDKKIDEDMTKDTEEN